MGPNEVLGFKIPLNTLCYTNIMVFLQMVAVESMKGVASAVGNGLNDFFAGSDMLKGDYRGLCMKVFFEAPTILARSVTMSPVFVSTTRNFIHRIEEELQKNINMAIGA